jgi:predicted membrane protein
MRARSPRQLVIIAPLLAMLFSFFFLAPRDSLLVLRNSPIILFFSLLLLLFSLSSFWMTVVEPCYILFALLSLPCA